MLHEKKIIECFFHNRTHPSPEFQLHEKGHIFFLSPYPATLFCLHSILPAGAGKMISQQTELREQKRYWNSNPSVNSLGKWMLLLPLLLVPVWSDVVHLSASQSAFSQLEAAAIALLHHALSYWDHCVMKEGLLPGFALVRTEIIADKVAVRWCLTLLMQAKMVNLGQFSHRAPDRLEVSSERQKPPNYPLCRTHHDNRFEHSHKTRVYILF